MPESTAIYPEKLDLVMRDEDFVIYYDGEPLKTEGGYEFANKDARLLKHILVKLTLNRENLPNSLNSSRVFSFLKDYIQNNQDFVRDNFDEIYENDFVVKTKFGGKHHRFINLSQILDYIEKNQDVMNLMFWGVSVIMESFRKFLASLEETASENNDTAKPDADFKKLILEKYNQMHPEQRAAINLLSVHHCNGLVLPMMLVLQIITPSEYANSTLAIHTNFDPVIESKCPLRQIKNLIIEPVIINWEYPVKSIVILHDEALKTLEFLSFYSPDRSKISVISEMISQGENDNLEFKSTFRWDIRQSKKNPEIEHAALKTMAAFLNSEGGDLLIGVEDNGNILGIETDNFPNDDKFLLHVWALIKTSMGQDVSPYLKTTLEKFGGKTVCRVHCKRSPKPIFLRQKGFDESFYIRIGPSTGSLEISEAIKYIGEHFGKGE